MSQDQSNKQILLCVDDEPSILKSLERCFVGEGYAVLKADSGQQGLDILQERAGKVDLIIVDQRMPQMSGDIFLKIAREKYGRLKAIMLSGYADFDSMLRAFNDGEIDRFIAKPWNNKDLVDMVRETLHPPKQQ